MWDFARRRLGREAADRLVAPMVLGVFAGDARRLSLPAAFPRLAELEAEHGSLVRGMIASGRRARAEREARAAAAASSAGSSASTSIQDAPAAGPAGPGGKLTSFKAGLETLPRALARVLAGGSAHVRCDATCRQHRSRRRRCVVGASRGRVDPSRRGGPRLRGVGGIAHGVESRARPRSRARADRLSAGRGGRARLRRGGGARYPARLRRAGAARRGLPRTRHPVGELLSSRAAAPTSTCWCAPCSAARSTRRPALPMRRRWWPGRATTCGGSSASNPRLVSRTYIGGSARFRSTSWVTATACVESKPPPLDSRASSSPATRFTVWRSARRRQPGSRPARRRPSGPAPYP